MQQHDNVTKKNVYVYLGHHAAQWKTDNTVIQL